MAPYVNLAIFADRNYLIGLLLIFVFGIAVFSSLFILPLFLQNVQGYPVLSAGWVVSARGVGTMVAMVTAGFLADRFPGKYLVIAGLACVGVSNLWMTGWNAEVSLAEVVWVTVINGYGMGMMWVSLTTVTFSTLAPDFRVEAAALFALVRSIGASMGTSVVVSILVRSSQINYIEMREHIDAFAATALAGTVSAIDPALHTLQRLVIDEARTVAFLNDFVFLVAVAFIGMPLCLLLQRTGRRA